MSVPKPKEFTKRCRTVNGLFILFWDKDSIYVQDKRQIVCFHKWFARKKMFYSQNWRPLMRYCTENNNPTLRKMCELAYSHDIEITHVDKLPVKMLDEVYKSHKERRHWHENY